MDHKYSPILKWKAGEKNALKNLSNNIKDSIIPIIEIVDDKKNLEISNWENRDFYLYIYEYLYNNNLSTFGLIIDKFNSQHLIPVIINNNTDDIINYIIYTIIYNNTNILAIRIKKEDISNSRKIINRIHSLIKKFPNIKVDLILDLLDISDDDLNNKNIDNLSDTINTLYKIINFRKIIISSTSIPKSLKGYKKGLINEQNRYEKNLFDKLCKKTNLKLIFSDYCTKNPKNSSPSSSGPIYFNIKYTTNDKYLIVIDNTRRNCAPAAVKNLCGLISSDTRYKGFAYSYGDEFIYKTLLHKSNCGNPAKWVTNSINHHITLIVNTLK